jgi:hypothetical protein
MQWNIFFLMGTPTTSKSPSANRSGRLKGTNCFSSLRHNRIPHKARRKSFGQVDPANTEKRPLKCAIFPMLTTTLWVSIIRLPAIDRTGTATAKSLESLGSTVDKKTKLPLLRGKIVASSADNRCRSDGDEYREFLGGSPVTRCSLLLQSESP